MKTMNQTITADTPADNQEIVETYDIPQRTPAQWARPLVPEDLPALIEHRKPKDYEVVHWMDRGGYVEVRLRPIVVDCQSVR